jgi:hypothetical protein
VVDKICRELAVLVLELSVVYTRVDGMLLPYPLFCTEYNGDITVLKRHARTHARPRGAHSLKDGRREVAVDDLRQI